MIKPRVCITVSEIRAFLASQELQVLISSGQEVKLAWGEMPFAVSCIITGYVPPADHAFGETLRVNWEDELDLTVDVSEITHFEVLPSQRMTSDLFLKQINEMDHAGGLS